MLTWVLAHGTGGSLPSLGLVVAGFAWIGAIMAYHRGWRRTSSPPRARLLSFVLGTTVGLAAVSPPMEHLGTELVSVHMVQHVMLILISAPLLALSRPAGHLMRAIPSQARKALGRFRRLSRLTPTTSDRLARPAIVWLLYGSAIWFWHGAGPYQLAARNPAVHVLEHFTFAAVALGFWTIVLAPRRQITPGYRILMVFTTAFHTVLLSALITFANEPWYPAYADSINERGGSPLADQQLAGLLMWIPGGLLYTGVGLWLLAQWIREPDHDHRKVVGTRPHAPGLFERHDWVSRREQQLAKAWRRHARRDPR